MAIGNQRAKAKVNAALQSASSVIALGHECYFRNGEIAEPMAGSDICSEVNAQWPDISKSSSGICDYDNSASFSINSSSSNSFFISEALAMVGPGPAAQPRNYFVIECAEASKKIVCGVAQSNYGCKIIEE